MFLLIYICKLTLFMKTKMYVLWGVWFFIWGCNRNTTSRGTMYQHLVAGIGMIIFHSLNALNLQDKVVFYTIVTLKVMKIKIFMLLVICMIIMLLLLQWLLFHVEGYVTLTLLSLFFCFLFSKRGNKNSIHIYCQS